MSPPTAQLGQQHRGRKSIPEQVGWLGQSSRQVAGAMHETDSLQSVTLDSIEDEQLVEGAFYLIGLQVL